ncbi:glycine-rich protein [Streptomyces vinaceus]
MEGAGVPDVGVYLVHNLPLERARHACGKAGSVSLLSSQVHRLVHDHGAGWRRLARRTVATAVALALPVAALGLTGAAPAAAAEQSVVFTTPGEHAFIVPDGVTSLDITLIGAAGGNGTGLVICGPVDCDGEFPGQGGPGAAVSARMAVTPGQALYANVGTGGGHGGVHNSAAGSGDGGDGGGASDIRTCPAADCPLTGSPATDPRVAVAGGGGGGASNEMVGGQGGRPDGGDGTGRGGGGATANAAGAAAAGANAGTVSAGGDGASAPAAGPGAAGGGGGGGGWFGGGGGADGTYASGNEGGGGGGSSFAATQLTSVVMSQGSGPASVTIRYTTGQVPAAPLVSAPVEGATTGAFPKFKGRALGEGGMVDADEVKILDADGTPLQTVGVRQSDGYFSWLRNGAWSTGEHTVRFVAMRGGLESAETTVNFTVAPGPATPVVTVPADGAETGPKPKFTGSAPGASQVLIQDTDNITIGQVSVRSDGYFSWKQPTPLEIGPHTVRFVAKNSLGLSAPKDVNFVVRVPAPVVNQPAPNSTTGAVPKFVGTAPAGSTVEFYENDVKIGSAGVNSSGNWSWRLTGEMGVWTHWTPGIHHIDAYTNSGGVQSPEHTTVTFTVQ